MGDIVPAARSKIKGHELEQERLSVTDARRACPFDGNLSDQYRSLRGCTLTSRIDRFDVHSILLELAS